MDEKFHRRKVTEGQKFDFTLNTEGFQEVFLPRVKALLQDADSKCHPTDIRFSEDAVKYHIGYYNGLMAVLKEIELIAKDSKRSKSWLDEHKLTD
jgi:uncharacterized protein YqcC (DUF446 family)